jgi:hypothetical protein
MHEPSDGPMRWSGRFRIKKLNDARSRAAWMFFVGCEKVPENGRNLALHGA